ncbi:MAG: hypothetical protein ACEY3D_09915 [Rickettsia sp.]|uniref:hypothetical protein n=1 Tax=Rickettsia sp. TaxID=789 RepID=UPI00397CB17D
MKTKKPSNAKTVLYPILDVGGIFSKYKKNNEFSFEEIRDKAWIENLKDNYWGKAAANIEQQSPWLSAKESEEFFK